jgi:hypothetical protein
LAAKVVGVVISIVLPPLCLFSLLEVAISMSEVMDMSGLGSNASSPSRSALSLSKPSLASRLGGGGSAGIDRDLRAQYDALLKELERKTRKIESMIKEGQQLRSLVANWQVRR